MLVFLSGERLLQIRQMKLIAERLGAHAFEERMRVEFALRDQIHVAEAARIVELEPRALLRLDHDVRVRGIGRFGVVEIAGLILRAEDRPAPGHAEMRDPDIAVVEMRQQIFRAPLQRIDAPPAQPRREALRETESANRRASCARA